MKPMIVEERRTASPGRQYQGILTGDVGGVPVGERGGEFVSDGSEERLQSGAHDGQPRMNPGVNGNRVRQRIPTIHGSLKLGQNLDGGKGKKRREISRKKERRKERKKKEKEKERKKF